MTPPSTTTSSQMPKFTLELTVENDGNYWVVSCPSLGMTAAHQKKAHACMRALRMFSGQLSYALNHDPTLSGLFRDRDPGKLEQLRELRQAKAPFAVCFEATAANFRAEIPDLMAATA